MCFCRSQFHAAAFMSLHVVFAKRKDHPRGTTGSLIITVCDCQHFQLFSTLKILDNKPEVKSLSLSVWVVGFPLPKLCFSCGIKFVESEIYSRAFPFGRFLITQGRK